MINFSRRDRIAETNEGLKAALTAASYGGAPAPSNTTTNSIAQTGVAARQPSPRGPATRDAVPLPAPVARDTSLAAPHPASTPTPGAAVSAASASDAQGSKLFIGVNILLKGVEISNCDTLVIEGNVEATVNSKVMEIAKPGTLKGTALIDVAEIHGDFSGELTARARLVVHGTGRVSGSIRYGRLIVAEGGQLSGDVKCLDEASQRPTPSHDSSESRASPPSSPAAH